MNSINLIGNLTKDFDLKYSQSGTAFVNGSVAVQRRFKNQQGEYETDFINLKAFGKTAENLANYFSKGSKIGISGSLQTGSYENKEGQRVYTNDVVVEQFTFVESRGANTGGQAQRANNNTQTNQNSTNQTRDPFAGSSIDVSDDMLPF